MKKIILSLFLLFSVFAYALREVNGVLYREYQNERFGFSVEYPPEILFMQPPPTNGAGRSFLSEEQDAEFIINGGYLLGPILDAGAGDSNEKQILAANYYYILTTEYPNAKITYQKLSEANGWYVISGVMNNEVFYRKVNLIRGSNSYYLTFIMKYPVSEKEMYDKILETIVKSIKY